MANSDLIFSSDEKIEQRFGNDFKSLGEPIENNLSNEEIGGIIRVGLPPLGIEKKVGLKEIQGKGLNLVYQSMADLKLLPDDYSSGNPFKAESSKKWMLDVWYSPSLGFSSVASSRPDVKSAYLQIRDSSESPVYFGSFGAAIGHKVNDLFFVSVGLQFNKRTEKFSGVYQWDEAQIKIDSIQHSYVVDPLQPPLIMVEYDTNISYLRRSKLLNHHVTFSTWEIPVRAGLRFDKENIVFSPMVGIVATWRTKISGNKLDPVLMEEVVVQPGLERQFNLSAVLATTIEWKLGQHLSFMIEPQYRHFFQSPYSSDYALKIKWQSIAMLTGLRVRF